MDGAVSVNSKIIYGRIQMGTENNNTNKQVNRRKCICALEDETKILLAEVTDKFQGIEYFKTAINRDKYLVSFVLDVSMLLL